MRVFATIVFLSTVVAQDEFTFEALYQFGKNEYTAGNWPDCVAFMRRAFDDFRLLQDENAWCREKCAQQVDAPRDPSIEIAYMFSQAEKALCLFRCKKDRLGSERPAVKETHTYEAFIKREPYRYLQICYWKMGDLRKAVESAYTFLVENPGHQEVSPVYECQVSFQTLENLAFYLERDGYNDDMLRDIMQLDYEKLYMQGVKAYEDQHWHDCIDKLENSIDKYLEQERKCRFLCEDKIDWSTVDGVNPEASIIMASVYTSVARCRYNCADKLGRVNGHRIAYFASSYFEYLHICQFNVMRSVDASRSVATSLMLDPEDPVMRRNRLFYALSHGKSELFEPLPVQIFSGSDNKVQKLVEFHKKRELEKRYIEFVDTRFKYKNGELPPERVDDRRPLDIEIDITDNFDYDVLTQPVLSVAECRDLRSPFPLAHFEPLIESVAERLNELFKTKRIKVLGAACGKSWREADWAEEWSSCRRQLAIAVSPAEECSAFIAANIDDDGRCVLRACASRE